MLRPSYSDLIEILNNQDDVDMKVTSRYTIVIAAAKRARQLIDGSANLVDMNSDKSVSVAIEEIAKGKISICVSKDYDEAASFRRTDPERTEYLSQEDLTLEK